MTDVRKLMDEPASKEHRPAAPRLLKVAGVGMAALLALSACGDTAGTAEEAGNEDAAQAENAEEDQAEEESDISAEETDSVCGLSAAARDGATLTEAPQTDEWAYDGVMAYPVSEEHGPAAEDESGFRYCYSRTPEGAVFFAANAAELGSSDIAPDWIEYATSDGGHREEHLRDNVDTEPGTDSDIRMDTEGFRVLTFNQDEAVVEISVMAQHTGQSLAMSAEYSLVWEGGDWKINADLEEPVSHVQVDEPGSQVVPWEQGA